MLKFVAPSRDIGPNFIVSKSTRICSAHFKPDDFFFSEFNIQTERHHLKPTAVPSIFPWTTERCRTSITSQIASSSHHRCEVAVPVDEFDLENFEDNFCGTTETHVGSDIEETGCVSKEDTSQMQKLTITIQQLQERITELSKSLQIAEDAAVKSLFRYENIIKTKMT